MYMVNTYSSEASFKYFATARFTMLEIDWYFCKYIVTFYDIMLCSTYIISQVEIRYVIYKTFTIGVRI